MCKIVDNRIAEPCGRYHPGQPWSAEQCRIAWLYHHDSHYNRLWNGQGLAAARRVSLPCRHLGPATGQAVSCPSCRGHVELKTFTCAVHGTCTPHKAVAGTACCQGCPDHAPATALGDQEPIRNLLFHVMPVSGNGVWQRRVAQLVKRIRLFNGRRVVAVVTGPNLDPPEHVQDQFAGHVHEFVCVPNDRALREVATFEPLFERVETTNARHVTLYAQAKGVTYDAASQGRGPAPTVEAWTAALYETLLDYWPLVERTLGDYPLAGAFRRDTCAWKESVSTWHYSGSWFWFRNRDLFGRPDWRKIDRFWSGIEPYPSLHFSVEQAACLFHTFALPPVFKGLYDPAYWDQTVVPDLERWRLEHQADKKEW